jgi:hypothetical protein
MSLLLKKILGNRDYLTYYYAQLILKGNADYDYVCNEGIGKPDTYSISDPYKIKSIMVSETPLTKCTFEYIFQDIEFLIIPHNINLTKKFYNTIHFLKNLNTILVIRPDNNDVFNVLRTLPQFTLKTLILENIEANNVKYLDNLPVGLEKVIFIHILYKYEKSKEAFNNMKMPFDCKVIHLVKQNSATTAVYKY